MGWWEEVHIFGGLVHGVEDIKFYKRYMDDLFYIWQGTEFAFLDFVKALNSNDFNLRFTHTFHSTSIDFLDLKLTGKGCKIESMVTDTGNSLLRADSCHPSHVFKAVPMGQFQRLRRNCSTDKEFVMQAVKLRDRFLERGYPLKRLVVAFTRAIKTERSELLSDSGGIGDQKRSVEKDTPMFITTFSCKFVTRKAKTVGNILSPSEVNKNAGTVSWLSTIGMFRCGAARCITCEFMFRSAEFTSSNTKRVYKIKDFINCNSSFVIYLLICTKCNIQYVGCTSRKFKCRMREHINQIVSHSSATVVSRHFSECSDRVCSHLRIQGIEKITPTAKGGDLMQRLLYREAYWIFTLETRQPLGLNLRFDISCHV
ncbi:hypothetical protein XELAEV_18002002mg [Xenopus laevis]|nr:hypothetical protein XELAEV_18002002mg [Xenopus laevis]